MVLRVPSAPLLTVVSKVLPFAGPMLDDHPHFHLQEVLDLGDLEGDRIGLTCPNCNYIQDALIDFLRARAGDRIGCPHCRRIFTIPTLEIA